MPADFLVTAAALVVDVEDAPLEVPVPVEEPPVPVATMVPAPVVGTLPVAVAFALVLHHTSPGLEALVRHSARALTFWPLARQ